MKTFRQFLTEAESFTITVEPKDLQKASELADEKFSGKYTLKSHTFIFKDEEVKFDFVAELDDLEIEYTE